MSRLEGIERKRRQQPVNGLYRLERKLWEEYNKLLLQEELIWYQKFRCAWQVRDRNSKFFHVTSMARKKKQKIEALQQEKRDWVEDPEGLKQLASNFYKQLYTKDQEVAWDPSWPQRFPQLDQTHLNVIHACVTEEEIKAAAFSMDAFKVPGPDGLQAHFFQSQWDKVGDKICKLVKEAFSDPKSISIINHTNIVLMPKVDNPTTLKEMRPISLCNVSFKILTKLIANKFRPIMHKMIEQQ